MSTHLCDSNVWVALVVEKHPHHRTAMQWFDGVDQPSSVFFCRATQQSLLRLLTNAALVARYELPPMTNAGAWSAYQALLADDRVAFRSGDPVGLEDDWKEFALRASASPNLWMDAYLAAFARSGGYTLVTTDRDFRQFEGVDLLLLGEA